MALQKFAHGATHCCKFKHTALCQNALLCDNKTTINKQILCRFHSSLSWNTPFFSCFTSREHADFIGCHFFRTHKLPRPTKAQLLGYCGKRSLLDVAKSWKVTLDRVPWSLGAMLKIWVTSSYVQFWLWPRLVYSSFLFLVLFLDFDTDSSVRSLPKVFLPTFFHLYW